MTIPSGGTARRRRRQLAAASVIVVVVIAAAGGIQIARHRSRAPTDGRAGMQGMAGMSGMAGTSSTSGASGPSGSGGAVHFTTEHIRQFGVTFGTVADRLLSTDVRATGTVTFDETGLAQVVPKFAGYVDHLYVNATGQAVRRGEPVAAIYSPEVVTAQDELLLAARLDTSVGRSTVPGVPSGASDLLGAAKRRLRLWDISEAQIDDVLTSGRVRRAVTLYAPVSGVVTDRKVVQGQAVQAGEALLLVADLSRVWVDAELREADAGLVRVGDRVQLDFPYPGVPIAGRVAYVYPTVGMESRTLRARIVIPNGDGRLRPGMYATVHLAAPSRRALTVPTSAVVHTGERALVFVDMGNGRFVPHDVGTGQVAGDYTEVLTGLQSGDRVVTSAQFLLDSESNLAEVMKSMIGMGGGSGRMNDKGADMRNMPGMPHADTGRR